MVQLPQKKEQWASNVTIIFLAMILTFSSASHMSGIGGLIATKQKTDYSIEREALEISLM